MTGGPGLLGFPPRTHHVLLPERPVRAARAALALYDATLPHQRVAAAAGEVMLRAGLGRVLRVDTVPAALDLNWWAQWSHEVGTGLVTGIHHFGFRLWEDRVAALLLDRGGVPLAFVKTWRDPPGPWRPEPDLQAGALARLAQAPAAAFRAPALLGEGSFAGWYYLAYQPLPAGRHRRMRPAPAQLHRIVDDLQQRLSGLHRPGAVPAHHVMSHGDLTPHNLRVAPNGQVWLFDWEYARWAPPLADELRFWVTDAALRRRSDPERHGRRIARWLELRGSRSDIAEALSWEDHVTANEAPIRRVIAREAGVGAA